MLRASLVAIAALLSPAGARAAGDDFYAGKTVRIIIGTTTAGEYGAYAQLMAQHIGRFIPGKPTVIVQTMLGGGGLVALNHLAKIAAAGRHGAFAPACQHRPGRAAESKGAVRSRPIPMDRPHGERRAGGRGVEPVEGALARGRQATRTDRRRLRRDQSDRPQSAHPQCAGRDQIQDRHRLQGNQRGPASPGSAARSTW